MFHVFTNSGVNVRNNISYNIKISLVSLMKQDAKHFQL